MRFKQLFAFNKESIAKSAVIVVVYSLVERAIMMGRGVVFARVLGPAEYGVFSLALSFFSVAVAMAKLGVPSCFTRYITQYEHKGTLRDFIRRTYRLVAFGAVGVGLGFVLFASRIAQWTYGSTTYATVVVICGLIVIPAVFYESLDSTFTGLRSFKLQSLLKFTHFLIFTVLGLILVIYFRTAVPLLTAYFFATLAVAVFFGGLLKKHLAEENGQHGVIAEQGFYKKIFAFSAAYFFSPVIFILFSYTDRWMLVRLTDIQQVGIYSAATKFSELIYAFGVIAGNVLCPNLSGLWEEGKRQKVIHLLNMSVKVNTLLLLVGAAALYLLKDQIVPWFYGDKYLHALPIIGAILIFGIYQTINATLSGFARLIEKTYIMPIVHALGLMCNLVLTYLLIPKYGILGAAVASAISSALISVVLFVWFHKEGLTVSLSMMIVCTLPLLLLLSKVWVFLIILVLVVLAMKTNWVMDDAERAMLLSQWGKVRTKFFAPKPSEPTSGLD
ncbi:MAG: oligosaccharide flippase family protein [Candidatus Firestonebacteria bacterium]|nr:oligosaccharide flippase family protein [Candidatus Firestonebacteria bacterium]